MGSIIATRVKPKEEPKDYTDAEGTGVYNIPFRGGKKRMLMSLGQSIFSGLTEGLTVVIGSMARWMEMVTAIESSKTTPRP